MVNFDSISTSKGPLIMANLGAKSDDFTQDNVIDCAGFKTALVFMQTGSITSATMTVTMQAGAASDGSDGADITGAAFSITDGDDNKAYAGLIDLARVGRYLSCVENHAAGSGSAPLIMAVFLFGAEGSRRVVHTALRDSGYSFNV